MKPIDIRNECWSDIQARVRKDRADVYAALASVGSQQVPVTTRRLAEYMGWDVLNVRPRVTELCELYLAECVGRQSREGLYSYVSWSVAQDRFELAKMADEIDEQMVMI